LDQHEYARLSPDLVLDAVESLGYVCDMRVLALNSYENRVYQVGIEGSTPIIVKFYRPSRWSDEQILEEHRFSQALQDLEIPVIAPLALPIQAATTPTDNTLADYKGFRFALYPRKGGHAPELDNLDTLLTLGQHLGQIHACGKMLAFEARPTLTIDSFGYQCRSYVLESGFLPSSLTESYTTLTAHLLEKIETIYALKSFADIRLHGDCHPGNILSHPESLFIVDLDDARNGPAIQDIWMLLSGDMEQKRAQLSSILEGYKEFCEFDYSEIRLIESLRTLRLIHYAAWLARRWEDPAFPKAFPWFNTERYWAEHILELREQLAELDLPSIRLQG